MNAVPWNTQRAIAAQHECGVSFAQIARDERCTIEQVVEIIKRAQAHKDGIRGFIRQQEQA